MQGKSIAVVEDESVIADAVAARLRKEGFEAYTAADGPGAIELCRTLRPDAVILDLMLPGIDGLEVCRRLRERGPVPVIMLTALGEESDRVLGLEVGADDYVTKPFSARELVLRVESVLRRASGNDRPALAGSTIVTLPPFMLDVAGHRATRDGTELTLTTREFDLLAFLLANPGRAFSRDELMERVWGWTYGDRSTVTVHIRRLRQKVEDDPAAPRHIVTVWGVGYRLDLPGLPSGAAPDAGVGT